MDIKTKSVTVADGALDAILRFPMLVRVLLSLVMDLALACLPVWPAELVWKVPVGLLIGVSTYAIAAAILDRVELGLRQQQLTDLLRAGE